MVFKNKQQKLHSCLRRKFSEFLLKSLRLLSNISRNRPFFYQIFYFCFIIFARCVNYDLCRHTATRWTSS
jgi:hypothetical protein